MTTNASNSGRPEGCLSPKEFASRSGASLSTIHRYLAQGVLLKIQRRGKNGRIWIPESELFSAQLPPSAKAESSSDCSPGLADEPAKETPAKPLRGKRPAWMNCLPNPTKGGNDAQ